MPLTIPKDFIYRWGIFALWLLLALTIFFRHPVPIDETRYLSVAWEMWLRNDFLLPYLNGHAYSHKPPLLFWLIHGGWLLFGVNEWWPRLIGPFCALGNLLLIRKLAIKLWPHSPGVALKSAWVLIATLLWTLFATSTLFDILLTCFVMLGMLGLLEAADGATCKGWSYLALALGLGLLTKGPVVFLHLLPVSILCCAWADSKRTAYTAWFGSLLLAVLAGIAIALCWAFPAASAGGDEYADAIFWHQTAARMAGTKIHARPFFWYLPFVPLMVFPWIAWPRFWQNLSRANLVQDRGIRFCLTWMVATFLLFCWLPSKQLHYLIPMMPAFALICTRVLSLDDNRRNLLSELLPVLFFALIGLSLIKLPLISGWAKLHWTQAVDSGWGLSIMVIALALTATTLARGKLSVLSLSAALVASVFISFIWFFKYTGSGFNLAPAALKIKYFQEHLVPTVFVGNYQGQFNFLGRLNQPLDVISPNQVQDWAQQHPDGYLISLAKNQPDRADFVQRHREHWLIFTTAAQSSSIARQPSAIRSASPVSQPRTLSNTH